MAFCNEIALRAMARLSVQKTVQWTVFCETQVSDNRRVFSATKPRKKSVLRRRLCGKEGKGMSDAKKCERLADELWRLTGLRLAGTEEEPPEETARKLQAVLDAFREKNSRHEFFRKLLTGQMGEELGSEAARLHLPEASRWGVLAVETEADAVTPAKNILRQMFAAGGYDCAVVTGARSLALVRHMKTREDPETLAHTVVDMLNTEGMLRARIAYGPPVSGLAPLSEAYREAQTALEIGRMFYSHENVIACDRLSMGRLIYGLSEETCRRFLKEVLGDRDIHGVDAETQLAVDTFFENNLNVSEAARQLFIHRNTLVYRLEKLRQATGLDIRVFEDAMTYRIASMVAGYLEEISKREHEKMRRIK